MKHLGFILDVTAIQWFDHDIAVVHCNRSVAALLVIQLQLSYPQIFNKMISLTSSLTNKHKDTTKDNHNLPSHQRNNTTKEVVNFSSLQDFFSVWYNYRIPCQPEVYICSMYQHKVAVDMLDAVKSVGWRFKRWSFVRGRATLFTTPAYPQQPYVDTLYLLPLYWGRPKLVLTGTNYSSIPLYTCSPFVWFREKATDSEAFTCHSFFITFHCAP